MSSAYKKETYDLVIGVGPRGYRSLLHHISSDVIMNISIFTNILKLKEITNE